MSNYWGKQLSSRPVFTTTSTAAPTKAGTQTYQLRVVTTTASSLAICDTSSTSTAVSAVVMVTVVAAAVGEYFSINPGQWYLPGPAMTVTEMS
jgi:hypothetical protein